MAIRIIAAPDVFVTAEEMRLYRDQWLKMCAHLCGTPPTLEEFIRQMQKAEASLNQPRARSGRR